MKHCKVENCIRPYYGKAYCQRHYDQMRRGVPIDSPSQKDHRPAKVEGEIARLPLGVDAQRGFAIVDRQFASLDSHRWSLDGYGYAITYIAGKFYKLHHLVLGKPPKGLVVDHINRNKLDNRSSNLRVTSQYMNMHNMSVPKTNTSGVVGVTWDKRRSKWIAQIRIAGKHKQLGRFESIEDAAAARLKAELEREQLYSKNN
jgi:hypothetical protein